MKIHKLPNVSLRYKNLHNITILVIGVKSFDSSVFRDILKECDLNDDGEVDFEEFQKCMLQSS